MELQHNSGNNKDTDRKHGETEGYEMHQMSQTGTELGTLQWYGVPLHFKSQATAEQMLS